MIKLLAHISGTEMHGDGEFSRSISRPEIRDFIKVQSHQEETEILLNSCCEIGKWQKWNIKWLRTHFSCHKFVALLASKGTSYPFFVIIPMRAEIYVPRLQVENTSRSRHGFYVWTRMCKHEKQSEQVLHASGASWITIFSSIETGKKLKLSYNYLIQVTNVWLINAWRSFCWFLLLLENEFEFALIVFMIICGKVLQSTLSYKRTSGVAPLQSISKTDNGHFETVKGHLRRAFFFSCK